jgi:hypothetical protein
MSMKEFVTIASITIFLVLGARAFNAHGSDRHCTTHYEGDGTIIVCCKTAYGTSCRRIT